MDKFVLARLMATQHVHIGMQKDGTVLAFAKEGETRTVILTKQIQFYIDHKMLDIISGGEAKLKEMAKFVNYGFNRIIWAEKLLDRFSTFDKFLKEVQYDDIAILPGTTKGFSEDMMFKIRPPEEQPKKTMEQIAEERKKALENADKEAEKEAEESRLQNKEDKIEKKRLEKLAKEQNAKDEEKKKKEADKLF